ncbi:MAG TPA: gliding motility-associated C-terminal domain-containing protein, partial [Saprospiraceae bacterium]|nr:gliding motility-associated C-terminal domain-containing protein [Saprospiraceae bacterium]
MRLFHLLSACTALLLALPALLSAQPEPCGTPAMMRPFCKDACVVCDINGFTGINTDNGIVGQAPPGFCTSEVHHMQWIAFIAGSTNLSLSVKVTNCAQGEGLEMGIYKSLDCNTFQLVSNCDTDVPNNTTQTFTNTTPLTVGQYYYFVMDGSQGDVCKYTISVVNGTTEVPPLPNSGTIKGPDLVCAGKAQKYTVQLPPGAARFEWAFDGVPLANGTDTTLNLLWNTPGTFNLCVTSSNACDTAAPSCRKIEVQAIAPTLLEPRLCKGECIEIGGKLFCNPGQYEVKLVGKNGCDSLVRANIQVFETTTTPLDLQICEGDTVRVGGKPFTQTGQYQTLLSTQHGCDSIVDLDLQVIVCNIQGNIGAQAVRCNGAPDGALHFSIQSGTPPFTYTWMRLGGGPSGNGSLSTLNSLQQIKDLPAGTYVVTVSDNFGNSRVLLEDIGEPAPLQITAIRSDYFGSPISCAGSSDGSISLSATGGQPPYQYAWSTGSTQPHISALAAGTYTYTLSDAAGCVRSASITLAEPQPLALNAHFTDPGCAGLNTGHAEVISAGGGVQPYTYALNTQPFGEKTAFGPLSPGPYALTLRDANGCTTQQRDTLSTPLLPEIELGPDITLKLGDSTTLSFSQNLPLSALAWAARPGLSCYACPRPDARPVRSTTYLLTVTAPGGCTAVDSVTVHIDDRRNVYIPNSFSPNDNGHNDRFTVYGGAEVLKIRKLRVYSRWGELVYEGTDLDPNQEAQGWDGRFRGRDLSPGVFAWYAQVEFIDGVTALYEGSVTVV